VTVGAAPDHHSREIDMSFSMDLTRSQLVRNEATFNEDGSGK
jgi:hypothetical protein